MPLLYGVSGWVGSCASTLSTQERVFGQWEHWTVPIVSRSIGPSSGMAKSPLQTRDQANHQCRGLGDNPVLPLSDGVYVSTRIRPASGLGHVDYLYNPSSLTRLTAQRTCCVSGRFVGFSQHTWKGPSRHNSLLIGRKNQVKFESDCVLRNGHIIKIIQPTAMIWYHSLLQKLFLSNVVKRYGTLGSQGILKIRRSAVYGTPGIYIYTLNQKISSRQTRFDLNNSRNI